MPALLTEINDSMVESIYIYYSLGGFGISSIGKVNWKEYVSIYQFNAGILHFYPEPC